MGRSLRVPSALAVLVALGVAAAPAAAADSLYATTDRTAAPGERALVRVRTDAKGEAIALLYRLEEPAAILDGGLDLGDGAALYAAWKAGLDAARAASGNRLPVLPLEPAAGHPSDAPAPRLTFISSRAIALTGDATTPTGQTIDVPVPAAGLYAIEVRAGTRATLVASLVSRLALVTKRDGTRLVAFAVDRTSGTAIAGVAVEVREGGRSLARGTTDAKGLASLPGTFPPTIEVRGAIDDDLAFGADLHASADVPARRVHAFPHQPAYRPGERVEVKGVVRARRDGRYALDADVHEVAVRLVASGGRVLGTSVAPVSADLGTFDVGFDLPKDAPTGDGRIVVEIGEKGYDAPFRIEAYRRPTFEVVVAPTAPRVAPGDPLVADVAASLYEGGPVAGATVAWTLTYSRVDRELFPTDELARLFFGTEREAYAPDPVANGTATLDAQGRARITIPVPVKREDGYLALRAVVTAPDRTTVAGSGGVGYSAVPLTVALETDRHLYATEGTARATVKAELADGRPAASRRGVLTAAVVSDAGPAGRAEEREVGSFPFTTDAAGVARIDVPFAENGRYRLAVALPRAETEAAGAPASASLHVYVVGDRAELGASGDRIELVADRDAYAVGDTARILVLAPVGARPVLTSVEGSTIAWLDTPTLGGASGTGSHAGGAAIVTRTITEDDAPNVYVGAALVDHGNLLTATRMLRIPPVTRRLLAVVNAESFAVEPGAKVPMSVRVTDSTGAPVVGAEVAVAVVDDALYGLYADPAVAMEPFFHPLRRNDVRTGGPLHVASVGWSVAAPPPAEQMDRMGAGRGAGGERERLAEPASAEAPRPSPAPSSPRSPAPPPSTDPGLDGDSGVLFGAEGDEDSPSKKSAAGAHGDEGPVTARSDFRTAIAWLPRLRTGADGVASLGTVVFADSTTRWRITARAIDASTRVGSAVARVAASKAVMTRVTLPRFLRVDDRVVAPWTLNSRMTTDEDALVVAGARGLELSGAREGRELLPAGAVRVRSLGLHATRVGEGVVTAEVRAGRASDAVRQSIPILPQGVPKVLAVSATGAATGPTDLPDLTIPSTADRDGGRLEIRVVASEAQAVAAAIPYLLDYPYGCTEQTMSRLVPVVVAKAARDVFHVPPGSRLEDADAMIDAGLARLRALRHADGGFGWWEKDASDAQMTAIVVHGLAQAAVARADAGATELLEGASAWLARWIRDPAGAASDRAETAAFARMALASAGALASADLPAASPAPGVSAAARAHLLRAALALGRSDDVRVHLDALVRLASSGEDGAGFPPAPGESAGSVETTAWALDAILAADPASPLLEPGVRRLLARRVDGARWAHTRETAACVAFLTHRAGKAGSAVARTVRVSMNGLALRPIPLTPSSAFSDDPVLVVGGGDWPSGPVKIRAEGDGIGPFLVSATLRFTDHGPAIEPAANGLGVEREMYVLEPVGTDGTMRRTKATESVPSGALVDVEVTVTASAEASFVLVESPHAAGFEPEADVGTRIDGGIGKAVEPDHVDRLDDRTAFFVKRLAPGTHVFRHRVRATHVGSFTLLPASAERMYAPEVRGSSRGEVLEITANGAAARAGGGR